MSRRYLPCAAAAVLAGALSSGYPIRAQQAPAADDALMKKARAIHEKVIALDTHDDISTNNFTAEQNYTKDLGNRVNLPKMFAGGLDAAFFIVYVGQGPLTPEGYDAAYKEAVALAQKAAKR